MRHAGTRVIGSQLTSLMRRAVTVARSDDREIAGVLVSHGGIIGLVELTNASRRRGHFQIRPDEFRTKTRAARQLGSTVVGTWHSHVVGFAEPGPGDIAGAIDGHLMLIIDTIGGEAAMWRIKNGRRYRVRLATV